MTEATTRSFPRITHITLDVIRCNRVLATEICGKISVASMRTLGHGEKTLLSSGWTLIGSELSSPNFNSSVRAERSFAIHYLNVVIKPLGGNLDICLNYYFRSRNSVLVLQSRTATESEICFFGLRFSVALLHNLAHFPSTRMHLMSAFFAY